MESEAAQAKATHDNGAWWAGGTRVAVYDLAKELAVHRSTMARWLSPVGSRGYRLRSFCIGRRVYTTRQEFAAWIAAINDVGEV